MNLLRTFHPVSLMLIAGSFLLIFAQGGSAQEKNSESKAMMQNSAGIEERLSAIEAKLRSLQARLDDLQGAQSDKLQQKAGVKPVAADAGVSRVDDERTGMEERFEALDQKLKIIERRRELEKESVAEKEKSTPVVSAGKDGFYFSSADKNFQLRFNGYLQADGKFFVGQPSPAIESFQLGRARPVFQGTIFKYFDFRIMPDFAGGQTVLQDLHLDFTYIPGAKLRFGKFKSPFGLEVLQGDTDLTFVNRAFPSALAPGRDVGAQVFGDIAGGSLSYAFSFVNGTSDGTSSDMDTNSGKDIVGRVFAHPFKNSSQTILKGLGIGAAVSNGDQQGSLPSFKTSGQAVFFSYVSGVTSDGNRYRLSPQAYYYVGPFGVLTEYTLSSQKVKKATTFGSIQNRAWQVAGSYVLGGKPSYRAVNPRKSFNPKEGGLGALELAARYGEIRLDQEAFSSGFADIAKSAKQARAFALGVNWYLAKMVKFVFNYEQTRFQRGNTIGNRDKEQALLGRFQIGF